MHKHTHVHPLESSSWTAEEALEDSNSCRLVQRGLDRDYHSCAVVRTSLDYHSLLGRLGGGGGAKKIIRVLKFWTIKAGTGPSASILTTRSS